MNNIKNQLIYLITLLLLILPICSSTANSIIKENQLSNKYIQDGANCLINKQYKEALEYFNQAVKLTPKNGVIYFNPEYGDRLGDEIELEETYARMGDFLKQQCKGYMGYIFTGNLELAKKIGLKPKKRIEFYTGKIDCRLFEYELYAGSREKK